MTGVSLFETGAASHTGLIRAHNEDAYLARPDIGLWAVADGMGGHENGGYASACVIEALNQISRPASPSDLLSQCRAAVKQANDAIRLKALDGVTIGTTLLTLLVVDDKFACVWTGDSRLYLVRGRTIMQCSEDHTEVQELLSAGLITPEQALTWPRRNVVTRALGVDDAPHLDLRHGQIHIGDVFVLCSDGLTNHIEPDEILASCDHGTQRAADRLIQLTLDRGAKDNVTVVLVRCLGFREPTVVFGVTSPFSEPSR